MGFIGGKAIVYTLQLWEKLCAYTAEGILQIDNNLEENSIRPVDLGRKNYVFAGSHERAQDAAILYSLFATCRLLHVNSEKWLTYLNENIRRTKRKRRITSTAALAMGYETNAKFYHSNLLAITRFVEGIRKNTKRVDQKGKKNYPKKMGTIKRNIFISLTTLSRV